MRYTEIFKLKNILADEGIPFEFKDRSSEFDGREAWQICYPVMLPNPDCVCSVIQSYGSYGAETDKLEIMGLLTDEEKTKDSVKGWLSAEEVFGRIKKHWEEEG